MATMQEMEAQIKDLAGMVRKLNAALDFANSKLEAHDTKINKKYWEKRPQKFWTLASRYVNGKFIVANPENPAVVIFDDHLKIPVMENGLPEDATLLPYQEEKGAPVNVPDTDLEKPYAEMRRGPPDKKAHEMDRTPARRPSDTDPAK